MSKLVYCNIVLSCSKLYTTHSNLETLQATAIPHKLYQGIQVRHCPQTTVITCLIDNEIGRNERGSEIL